MNARTHVFAVAVESYQDPVFPQAMYVESDARKFVEAWQGLGVDPERIVLLSGSQATKTAVQSRLKKFAQNVGSGDRIVFFYAGHGVSLDGSDYLSVHDSLSDDFEETTVSLRHVLRSISMAAEVSTALFLDVSRQKLPVADSFQGRELKEFCVESSSRIAFVSASANEFSQLNLALRQGLWAQHLNAALHGKAKSAISPSGMTAASLQNYLTEEVSRQARVEGVSQTPYVVGEGVDSVVIVDAVAPRSANEGVSIKGSRLLGESQGRVRSLSGFAKFHKEPDTHTSRFAQFVESLGLKEVEDRTTEIFERVRSGFKYKRKELFFDQEGAIKTPDFDVQVRLTQDPVTPNMYLLTTAVEVLRADIVQDPAFLEIFARYCSTVTVDLAGSLNIEAKIDDIEENDVLRDHLEYDPACTEFTLRFPGTDMVLHASETRLRFTSAGRGDLLSLIQGTQSALSRLSEARIDLGLPEAKS